MVEYDIIGSLSKVKLTTVQSFETIFPLKGALLYDNN